MLTEPRKHGQDLGVSILESVQSREFARVAVGCPFGCAQVRNWEETCEATVYSHEDSGIGDALALVNSKLAPDGTLEQKRNGKVVSEHSGVDAAECSGRPDK